MPPIGTSARLGRTWLRWAANNDPAAMPIAKVARQSVTTPSVPPTPSLITAGSSDSTTAPTSQNHDTIPMPSHRRGSDHRVFSSRTVEVHGLRVIGRSGADGTVTGIRDANAQHATERPPPARETTPTCDAPDTTTPPA